MRLIDADALMGVDIKIGHIGEKTVRAIQWATVDAFYRNIDEAPTIDAAPVVRGEWIESDNYKGWLVCSACHDCYVDNAWVNRKKWRYCPNCGCKMEGKP